MATMKFNVMSVVAIILAITAVIAIVLLETGYSYTNNPYLNISQPNNKSPLSNTYLAFLIIAIILSSVVFIVTCLDLEPVTSKTYLVYALTAALLLVGVILFALHLSANSTTNSFLGQFGNSILDSMKPENTYLHYASIVSACIALIAAITGVVAPFVCNERAMYVTRGPE